MKDALKNISIRGRLAMGAICLENAFLKYDIADPLITDRILPLIWEFTTSDDLGSWDEAVRQIDPVSVLVDKASDTQLAKFYTQLSPNVCDMIEDVIEIGVGNLYGATGDYSEFSLKPLLRVLKMCEVADIPIPDLMRFQRSSFSEEHGWGFAHIRSFYL